MATLTVGIGKQFQYHTIAAAVNASHNGDVVLVQAGTYTNDFVTISDSITLQSVGGMVVINATVPPPNGMAIITEGGTGTNITISGFELTGAAVPDNNGAAIRYQGGNLTLTNDYIANNQNGIMGNPWVAGTGTVSISNCQFTGNGEGNGTTHNIYIGNVATLSISNSLITSAVVGHEIKSRALNTIITNNVIADGPTGTASYSIDLPNGGNATITGNVIEKGPNSENPSFIAYGEEGASNPGSSVTIANNSFLNDRAGSSVRAVWNTTSANITFDSNQVYGLSAAQLFNGTGAATNTSYLGTEPAVNTTSPWSAAAALPGVSSLALSTVNGDLGLGDTATYTLTFNEAVTVTGTPSLKLNDGGTATYVSGSGTNALVFQYTVLAGQTQGSLYITGVTLPSGASIKDAAGNTASLLPAMANPTGRLIIDTTDTRTTISAGSGQTVNAGTGKDLVVLASGTATLGFHGTGDIAFLGGGAGTVNATINDSSSGLIAYVLNGGNDVFTGFASDPTAVVDLLGGIGGYTTVASVLAALTADGSGGTKLSLGFGQTIDFVGVAPASLHSTNFQIG